MATELALEFAESLIGTPYKYYHIGDTVASVDDGPFWAVNGPVPSVETIKASCCHCAGLPNLIRRKLGLSVPGVKEGWEVPGGTPVWFWYLEKEERLELFNPEEEYPDGTLVLRKYRSETDQGHLLIKRKNKGLQSYPNEDYNPNDRSKLEPGVNMLVTLKESHELVDGGYYEYICRPENWLEKD